jgi:hypothetical protein
MKKYVLAIFVTVLALGISASAQRNIEPKLDTDPVLEQDAKHNLDVAWQAYRLKKAYKGVLMRFEETYAAYPNFSKMDEFLYMAGMSSYYLSENKGKQKIDLKSIKEKGTAQERSGQSLRGCANRKVCTAPNDIWTYLTMAGTNICTAVKADTVVLLLPIMESDWSARIFTFIG